jgi:ArsR family transcriptional regulator
MVGRMRELLLYFSALADRKRLLIVRYLARHKEVTVTHLGTELRFSQPLMSWHLRVLRRAGIVKTRREGRQVWCSLDRHALGTYEQRVDRILGLNREEDRPAAEAQEASLPHAGRS